MPCKKSVKGFRERQRATGGCVDCVKQAVSGKIRCKEHLKKQVKYRMEFKKEQKAMGLCLDCHNPVVHGHRYCEKHLKSKAERQKKTRIRLKEKGICTHCYGPLDRDDRLQCVNCRERIYNNDVRGCSKKIV
jgi:hypothetical protein